MNQEKNEFTSLNDLYMHLANGLTLVHKITGTQVKLIQGRMFHKFLCDDRFTQVKKNYSFNDLTDWRVI